MKIRKLADAAIVAALLLTSIPDLNVPLTRDDLLTPHVLTEAAHTEDPVPDEDHSVSRGLS